MKIGHREVYLIHLYMNYKWIIIVSLILGNSSGVLTQAPITKIAFGSCGKQDKNQPILDLVTQYKPDLFLFLGDNIYGDTRDMKELKAKYDKLGAKPEYQRLKASTKIYATWDDHDFGWNDAGRHYPYKEESKEIFLNFFEEPLNSDRRKRPGVYTSYDFGKKGQRVKIIMLDTRTFRDDLLMYSGQVKEDKRYFYDLDYTPHSTGDSTLLGKEQWIWLEDQLSQPADLRIICSSTQFGIEYNGYEAWANFPHEQKKILDIIKKTKAGGVIFLTGDVHYSEISSFKEEGHYPIYDFTSSGITSTWHFPTPNSNRIEGPVMENHFGLLSIDWNAANPILKMECIDVRNNPRFEFTIPLNTIQFRLK